MYFLNQTEQSVKYDIYTIKFEVNLTKLSFLFKTVRSHKFKSLVKFIININL